MPYTIPGGPAMPCCPGRPCCPLTPISPGGPSFPVRKKGVGEEKGHYH